MLEQAQIAHGLAGAQVVTGTLSAFVFAKEHLGELCSSWYGFVNLGKVDQSSIPKHIFSSLLYLRKA